MTAAEIVKQLKSLGTDSYKKILRNHGANEPVFGVKVEELKKIQKRVKKDYRIACELYDTGIYDAQYLAGLVADEDQMTIKDLQGWVANANCAAIGGTAVAWVAAESRHGWDLALKWIDSKKESVAEAGWETLVGMVSIKDDSELDLVRLKQLLKGVEESIRDAPNCVRYSMNAFVIAVGIYVKPLADLAMTTAEKIGPVTVDMGNTACKVPLAPEYIKKAQKRGVVGKKRKTARC